MLVEGHIITGWAPAATKCQSKANCFSKGR